MIDIRRIDTEADYDWALREIAPYFDTEPEPGTPDAHRMSVLAALIGAYESRVWPIEPADAVETIKEVLRERGLRPADLGRVLGSRSRATEILRRQRPLTMEQAWRLHQAWHIPAEVLIRPAAAAPGEERADAAA